MANIAVLGLRVDASGAIVATQSLGTALNRLGQDAENAERRTTGASNAIEKGLKRLGGALTVGFALRQLAELSDTYTQLRARLSLVTTSTENLNQVQQSLFEIAQRTRSSFEGTAELYGRIARSATELGISQNQILKVTESVNKAFTISGTSAASAQAALVQLSQAFASGVLRGEELNSVLEQAPRLAQAIADGLGVPIGKLRELGKAGELTSDQVVQALLKQSGSIDKEFDRIPLTINGAIQQVKNAFVQFVGGAGDASGAAQGVAKAIASIAPLIGPVGKALALIFTIIGDGVRIFIDFGEKLGILAVKLVAFGSAAKALATGDLVAYKAALGEIAVANKEEAAATDRLKKSLSESNAIRKQILSGASGPQTGLAGGADAEDGILRRTKLESEAQAKAKAAAQDRLRAAQQELALIQLTGQARAEQEVRDKAELERRKAVRDLKGDELRITLEAIALEEQAGLGEARVEAQKELLELTKKINQESAQRIRNAADNLLFAELEGKALALAQSEAQAANDILAARASITNPQLLSQAEEAILKEKALRDQAIEVNDALEQRKARQEQLNDRAGEILKQQERQAETFERQFLQTVSSGIEGVLKNGLTGFKGFVDSIKNLFLKLFADLLAANVFKKLTTSLGALIPGAALDLKNVANANFGTGGGFQGFLGSGLGKGIAGGLAGGAVGFGVGSLTENRTLGAAGGALSGAAAGFAVGGPVGAIVGGVAGLVGGLLGSSKKAKEAAEQMRQAREAFDTNLKAFVDKAAGTDTPLKAGLREIENQRKQLLEQAKAFLPKGTKVTGDPDGIIKLYDTLAASGNRLLQAAAKNLAPYVEKLREINAVAADLRKKAEEEFATQQRQAQEDLQIRRLIAEGKSAEAEALKLSTQQERQRAELIKAGATEATLAALAETQLAEARRAQIEQAEGERRRLSDLQLGTLELTDPRGAAQQRDIEEANRRVFDAIQRGASEAELAAIGFYNAALLAAREAERLENDRRTSESLLVRGLQAAGNTRGAEDAALASSQRQELVDAIKSGFSPTNLALLEFVQFAEREALLTRRAIEDGTKAINEAARGQAADLDELIGATRAAAAVQIAAINAQIDSIKSQTTATIKGYDNQIAAIKEQTKLRTDAVDAQINAARQSVELQKAQLQKLEQSVSTNRQVVQALQDFGDSLLLGNLSPLSPEDQLAEARRQFDTLTQRALGGDAEAAQGLPDAARALLEASRGFNATNPAFVSDFNRVQEVLNTVKQQFGASLPVEEQQLEALRRSVQGTEATIEALGAQRESIEREAAKQIEKLEEAKQQAKDSADRLIEVLEKQKDTISADAEATIQKLEEQKQAIFEAAERQIEQLIADENAKLQTRLKENEFYDLFKSYAEGAGTYFTRAVEKLNEDEVLGPGAADGTGGGTPGNANGPVPVAESLANTVTELQTANRQLNDLLSRTVERLDRVVSVIVAANEDENFLGSRIVQATNEVASEVRAAAQAAATRTNRPVGLGGGGTVGLI